MNRRQFIKSAGVAAPLPAITLTCKYEDDEKVPEKKSGVNWDYRVYCYEREQGEWVFSQNVRGSFAYQREYMTFEEDKGAPYAGWMDGGKLHFASFDDATDVVDMHVRAKDDINLMDSIYDIYYLDWDDPRLIDKPELNPTEIQVAHYWFNADTGRQINWQSSIQKSAIATNWNRVERA